MFENVLFWTEAMKLKRRFGSAGFMGENATRRLLYLSFLPKEERVHFVALCHFEVPLEKPQAVLYFTHKKNAIVSATSSQLREESYTLENVDLSMWT